MIVIGESSTHKLGYQVRLKLITQHYLDDQLMKSLVSYLGCGRHVARSTGSASDFIVTSFSDISDHKK
jgi:hypothetical protein